MKTAPPHVLPPPIFDARCKACWMVLGLLALVVASFASLDLQWGQFLSMEAMRSMARFVGEFFPPDTSPAFLRKLAWATVETLAMSIVGTVLAACFGLLLALPASARARGSRLEGWGRSLTRWALNALRAIPELVWAALLLVVVGLGPFAGTLALGLHTTGVLGRLAAEALDNAPPEPSAALRAQGVEGLRLLGYATLPQIGPQLLSYALYRWENNIRAATVLGVVGAGGLGQMLAFHLGLFQMGKTASVLLAMLALVALVDHFSDAVRRRLMRT